VNPSTCPALSCRLLRACALLALLCLAPSAAAQALVLRDGTRVPAEMFKVENGKIIRTITLQGSNSATSVLDPKAIAELDWPYAAELTESRSLLAQGKTGEAIEVLKTGKDFFEAFREVKNGEGFYRDVFMAYVEALSQGGEFEETVRMIPQLQRVKLTPGQETRLKVIKLNIERQTSSDYTAILAQAQNILADTDDSSISAAVWAIIGDVHDKKKDYEKALMAYLRIPVFFGTQMQRVPEAELNAARMLVKMRRFEDAQNVYTRLIETYPNSAISETATREKAPINGMKNDDTPTGAGDSAAGPAENASQS
jgi:tetratricopeptide (TPR) repeat protein